MKTKKEIREIAIQYLKERKRKYLAIENEDSISLLTNKELLYGSRKNEIVDVFTVEYSVQWGLEEKGMLVYIDAETGEVLYSISPTSWIEELEDQTE